MESEQKYSGQEFISVFLDIDSLGGIFKSTKVAEFSFTEDMLLIKHTDGLSSKRHSTQHIQRNSFSYKTVNPVR